MPDRASREAARSEPFGQEHLKELLRSGALSPEVVGLAAALGDPAALVLYPDAAQLDWSSSGEDASPRRVALRRVAELAGIAPVIRAAADWAERVLPVWESWAPADPRPRQAIAAARTAAEEPTHERRQEADRAADLADDAYDVAAGATDSAGPEAAAAAFAASWAAVAASESGTCDVSQSAETVSTHALRAVPHADLAAEGIWQRSRLAAHLLDRLP